jgi:surface protein
MLYSELMHQICEKLGVKREECKDGLYSTLLQTISDACDGGGNSGGGEEEWYITDAQYLFYNGARLDAMDELLAKCKGVTSMTNMFNKCSQLTSLDMSRFDTSQVTALSSLFSGCSKLTTVGNISNWDTSKVTHMGNVFNSCPELVSIDISGWDTSKVTIMGNMFVGCTKMVEIIGFSATNQEGMSIGFPFSNNAAFRQALKRLTFRTDLPDGVYSIRSAINIKNCSFERDGMVEMFNTLPDVSGLGLSSSYTTITITGNPCVTNATLTAEDEAIATAKGWTLVK